MERLWYVAYGSNLSRQRFLCYLRGGRPQGGARAYPGCRDHTDPAADEAVLIRGTVYFAGTSTVWGGGMAFYDGRGDEEIPARAYLLTGEQFADVVAQEMRQPPGASLDLTPLSRSRLHSFGPGRYQTLVRVGTRRGLAMLTFTSDSHDKPWNAPTAAYLATMAAGIRQRHGWTPARIAAYLARRPGVTPTWTPAGLRDLADDVATARSGRFTSGPAPH